MFRYIEKDYIPIHDGDVVFLETRDGSGINHNGLVTIQGLYGRDYDLYRINWDGMGRSGSLSMKNYDSDWRLWSVTTDTPTAYARDHLAWKQKRRTAS